MKVSIFTRIFGGYLFVIVAISFLIPILSFKAIKQTYTDMFTNNLKNLGVSLCPQVRTYLEERQIRALDSFAKGLRGQIHTRITVINPEGVVLADSERNPETMENHKERPEIEEALKGNIGKSVRFSITVDEEMLYVAVPVEKDGKILGVLRMSAFLKEINMLLSDLRTQILQIAFLVTIISLMVALLISRGISKPIRKLVQAARSLSRGDFSSRITVTNQEELSELADSFNEMAVRMRDLFVDLSRQNEELATIISSIEEVLVVLTKDGTIKLSNNSFKRMIADNAPEGKFFWGVLRSPGFDDLINRAKQERRHVVGEVEINERSYLCSATFLSSKDEIVTVCHDITDLKNLEKIKKDFVANISHELRTPLTAIKGFVETLEEEEQIENVRYLEIIKRHTERLMNIVGDLLLLSELEEKGSEIQFEEVSLKGLVENLLRIFEPKVKEKGLTLTLDAGEAGLVIEADPFKLEQMFINLLDNAVKYTDSGEIKVTLKRRNGNVEASVEDTGIGISADHLKRIFERFYVVDKSRSKRLGGTGLGLSIVKHIILIHGGSIGVESTIGKGTKFIVTLPTNP